MRLVRRTAQILAGAALALLLLNAGAVLWFWRTYMSVPRFPRKHPPLAVAHEGNDMRIVLANGAAMQFRLFAGLESGPLWVCMHETTQAQFSAFADDAGYRTLAERRGRGWEWSGKEFVLIAGASWRNRAPPRAPDAAVSMMAWVDARAFAAWLSAETGLSVRLPTTPEWQALCAAGRPADSSAVLSSRAWFDEQASQAQPVGTKAPDDLGLYDVLGNVWEWHDNGISIPDLRWQNLGGGSWLNGERQLRCDCEGTPAEHVTIAEPHIGFRVVIDADSQPAR